MKGKFYLLFLTVLTIFIFPDKVLGNGAFVEVTKAHGDLTQEHFKTLQSHGIDGIIIQLARGKKATDAGVNSFAPQQIAGVRAVGLKLAVSFVSTAQSPEEAIAEANELVAQIRSLGCPSDTPVVNELSDPSLAGTDLTPSAAAFRNQLLTSGFTNVFQHCHVDLLQRGRLRPGELGGVGAFLLEGTPDLTSVFNAAAKKTEDRLFPGISIPLSVNTDYVGAFTSSSELALTSASFAHLAQLQTTDPNMMQNLFLAARAGVGAVGAMQANFMQQLTAFGSQLQRMDPSVTNTQNLSIQASPDGVLSVAFISQTSASFAANPEIMRLEQERLNLEQIRLKRERLDTEHKKQKAIRLAQEERLRKFAASIDAEQKCLSEFTIKVSAGQKLLADLKSKVSVEGKRLNDLTLKVETEQKNLTDFTAKVAAEQKRLSGLVGETAAKQKQLSELTPKIPSEQKRLADFTAKVVSEQKRLNDLAHSAAEEQRHLDDLHARAAGQQERLNNINRDNDNLRRQIG